MSSAARTWDANTYHRVSSPHVEWAQDVLDRLDLGGDETVLDAGCGSGRVTRLLNGLDDIALTLAQEDAIASYERERERSGPITTAL